METKTHSPSFTVSLRGYDREEVDHYIDSLAEALEQVDDSSEQNHRLQAHVNQLNARIKELEDRIHSEAPRTGALVGERIRHPPPGGGGGRVRNRRPGRDQGGRNPRRRRKPRRAKPTRSFAPHWPEARTSLAGSSQRLGPRRPR